MTATDDAVAVLASAQTVVVIDWPSQDVPAGLARAGLGVWVKGGPRPDQYTQYEVAGADVVVRQAGHAPDHADLVYAYRPLDELPGILALAETVGARAIWRESASPGDDEQRARELVEAAGLRYLSGPDIVGAICEARRTRRG
ncbi:MAG: hypothetical protein M3326_00115 [Actinomycetota bacterium]|nr:hypothetical protein [Actinomycetota bacterium]